MARIRNIKPEFFDDTDIATLTPWARLAFIGLWTEADREGRVVDDPIRLKARLFSSDLSPQHGGLDMDALLSELTAADFIRRYVVNGSAVIWVRQFKKHQYVSKREPASELPDGSQATPVESQPSPVPVLDEAQTGTTDYGHRTMDKGQGTVDRSAKADVHERFNAFWEAYPKKTAKPDAEKAFKALKVSAPMLEILLAALAVQRVSQQWQDKQYIPHPATWLRGRRWEDETEKHVHDPPPSADSDWWHDCQHEPHCGARTQHRELVRIEQARATRATEATNCRAQPARVGRR